MVKLRTILGLFALFACLGPVPAFAARVQAVADRDRMSASESLHLELRVEGAADSDPNLSVLDKDWEVLSRSQSSQVRIVNGEFSRSVVYSLTLMPRREGEVTIPAVCFGSECSVPLPVTVAAVGDSSSPAQDAPLLLEAEIAPRQVVSQGQLLLKLRLLHRGDLLQGSLSEPQPGGVEAVVQKLGEDRKYETRRGGLLYQVIERDYAIFPQAAGTLRIPSLQFDGAVAGAPSRLDPFGRRGERVRLRSKPLQVAVTPVPADRGDRPWLPARALRLADDWQGRTVQLTVGEPATRTLTVEAEGLQAAQLPDLQVQPPDGFKAYPDQPERQDRPGDSGLTGVLQQKIALVPTRPGHYRLPGITLDWWDVTTRQWRQATIAPVAIEVVPAAGAAGGAASPPVSPATPGAPFQPAAQPPAAVPAPSPGVTSPGFWPWLSLALGLGWLGTLLLLWKHRCASCKKPADPTENPAGREKSARRAAVQAACGNDPRAARRSLAAWSATLPGFDGRPDLERLGRMASTELGEAMAELDRVLYTGGGEGWSGVALGEALRQWRPEAESGAARGALPDLYNG